MLPSPSWVEGCRQIKLDPTIRDLSIGLRTVRGDERDRIRGLDWDADNYIIQPSSPVKLVGRMRAVLRRIRTALDDIELQVQGVAMDLTQHRVTRGDLPVQLSPTEHQLLHHFTEHPGRVHFHDQFLETVWGDNIHVQKRTVYAHIRRFHKVFNKDGKYDMIRTARSTG